MVKSVFFIFAKKPRKTITMHVRGFLHKLLHSVIHQSRLNALSDVVQSAINGKKLSLSGMGRAIDLPIQERSGIQKVNRLLGNESLLIERKIISGKIADLLIGNKKRVEIVVDWSKLPNSEEGIMRASLSAEGRALTLYEERWAFKLMGNKKKQKQFLANLKEVLPRTCQPIIVTDAGFYNDWFKEIVKYGWDYVGRIRNVKKCRKIGTDQFKYTRSLFKLATITPTYLGKFQLTEDNPLDCFFYLMRSSLKGRKARKRNGEIRCDKGSKAYSRSYREPWLLASSLSRRSSAKRIMEIYKRRMTIEEAFRDIKSSKYGLGLEQSMTRIGSRRDILLLIAMLACVIAWLVGKVGEAKQYHYKFQSNSVKNRRVISLCFLGCQMIRKKIPIKLKEIWDAASIMEAVYD